MRKLDFPRLRAFNLCPLCGHAKPRGGLACWDCFNARGLGAGDADPWAEGRFERAERALKSATDHLIERLHSVEHGPARCVPLIDKVL
jgi:hypothetical protein